MRWPMFFAVCLLCAQTARAADEVELQAVAVQPERTKLLDQVPNYPEILRHQWSRDVVLDLGPEEKHYGLLSDAGRPRGITLEESIALALENNTSLRVQQLNPIAATAAVRQARAVFDPELFAEASKQRSNTLNSTLSPFTGGGTVNPTPVPGTGDPDAFDQNVDWNAGARKTLLTGARVSAEWTNTRISSDPTVINLVVPTYASTLGVSLTQPLLRDFGWRFTLLIIDARQIDEEAAFYTYKAGVATIVAAVERAYWVLVLADEAVRVDEQGLALAKELLRQNEGRFKVGALPRTAVLESEAEVARREANLIRSTAARRIARDNLRALMNAREGQTDELVLIEPSDRPTVVTYDIDLDRSLKTAYEKRPELIAARLGLDSSTVQTKIAENQLLPRLDFIGSIGLNGLGGSAVNPALTSQFGQPNPRVLGGYDNALDTLVNGQYYQYLFGAQIQIPIANADAKAKYAQARVAAEQARLSLQQTEENVTLDITQAANNLKALLKSIDATRIARELAEENVRNQQARYDVGLATTKDLIDYQDRLTQAQRAEIEALVLYNTQLADLRRADGTLLEARNILIERTPPEAAPWWAQF